MAHECPDCYMLCHCGGDIDDLCMDIPEHVYNCSHCPDDWEEDDWDYDDWDYDEYEESQPASEE